MGFSICIYTFKQFFTVITPPVQALSQRDCLKMWFLWCGTKWLFCVSSIFLVQTFSLQKTQQWFKHLRLPTTSQTNISDCIFKRQNALLHPEWISVFYSPLWFTLKSPQEKGDLANSRGRRNAHRYVPVFYDDELKKSEIYHLMAHKFLVTDCHTDIIWFASMIARLLCQTTSVAKLQLCWMRTSDWPVWGEWFMNTRHFNHIT